MLLCEALAQDQLRSIQEFTGCGSIIPAAACVCDGDTSQSERFAVQERGNIILTNPDMLHVTLLPEVNLQLQRQKFCY